MMNIAAQSRREVITHATRTRPDATDIGAGAGAGASAGTGVDAGVDAGWA